MSFKNMSLDQAPHLRSVEPRPQNICNTAIVYSCEKQKKRECNYIHKGPLYWALLGSWGPITAVSTNVSGLHWLGEAGCAELLWCLLRWHEDGSLSAGPGSCQGPGPLQAPKDTAWIIRHSRFAEVGWWFCDESSRTHLHLRHRLSRQHGLIHNAAASQ